MKEAKSAFKLFLLSAGLGWGLALSGCITAGDSANASTGINEIHEKVDGVSNPRSEADGLVASEWAIESGKTDHGQRFRRIWHEDSDVPIETVPTPEGFTISPAQAYHPLRETVSRPYFLQWHLYVDAAHYYIVVYNAREKNTPVGEATLSRIPAHSKVINGTSGKISEHTGK